MDTTSPICHGCDMDAIVSTLTEVLEKAAADGLPFNAPETEAKIREWIEKGLLDIPCADHSEAYWRKQKDEAREKQAAQVCCIVEEDEYHSKTCPRGWDEV